MKSANPNLTAADQRRLARRLQIQDAALELVAEFRDSAPTCVIVKHANPCGVATASDSADRASRVVASIAVFAAIASKKVSRACSMRWYRRTSTTVTCGLATNQPAASIW